MKNREIKYRVYFDKAVPYIGGKMWAVVGMSWREYIDDGEPENPIRQNVVDLDIADLEDFEKGNYTKSSWQGEYIKDKFYLREFTGLKDKNETPIFEGDILKANYGGEKRQFKVFWSNNVGAWATEEIGGWDVMEKHGSIFPQDGMKKCKVEVIGNVFENPELLK